LLSNTAPRGRGQSSRQIGPLGDQYGIFRDVSRVPSAYWSEHTPQSYYLLSSREGAIFVSGNIRHRASEMAIVIDEAEINYDCMKPERIAARLSRFEVSFYFPLPQYRSLYT